MEEKKQNLLIIFSLVFQHKKDKICIFIFSLLFSSLKSDILESEAEAGNRGGQSRGLLLYGLFRKERVQQKLSTWI